MMELEIYCYNRAAEAAHPLLHRHIYPFALSQVRRKCNSAVASVKVSDKQKPSGAYVDQTLSYRIQIVTAQLPGYILLTVVAATICLL